MSVRVYLALPVLLILLVVQVALAPHIELLGIAPQLLFLITVVWALYYGLHQGLIWAFVAGLLIDIFSAGPVGATSLALMAAVFTIANIQRLFPENRVLVPAALGALASLVFWFAYILLLRILVPFMISSMDYLSIVAVANGSQARDLMGEIAQSYGLGGSIGNLVFRSTILHGLLTVPLFWGLAALDRLVRPKPVEI